MKGLWNRFLGKILSARFLVTLMVISTLCFIVIKSLELTINVVHDEKAFTLAKEIVMFILGAFISVVTAIVTSYFQRVDRVNHDTEIDKPPVGGEIK